MQNHNRIELFDSLCSEAKKLTNICYSGGADGSDRFFGIWSIENNHELIHFTFDGHKYKGHSEEHNVKVPSTALETQEIFELLNKANSNLNRRVPSKGYVYNLLARNYYQIKYTERVYCIVQEVNKNTVGGGTGWAVEMYRQLSSAPEIYAYNISTDKCYMYDSFRDKFIEVYNVPKPHGQYTGIGSRNCTQQDFDKFSARFVEV